MDYKKVIFISILILFLSVAAVSATDLDNNYASESLSIDDSLSGGDSLFESSEIQNSEILSDEIGTFEDLQVEINNAPDGSVLNLTRDYNGHEGNVIHLDKDLTIDGQGHTLDCLNAEGCSVFYSESGTITLKNLKIINGLTVTNYVSGAISILGSAQYTLENCTFEHFVAPHAAVITNRVNKTLTIKDCTFHSINSGASGGAVCSSGFLSVKNSVFDSCIVDGDSSSGGAIQITEGAIIEDSIFKNNFAACAGGAIKAYYKDLVINRCLFENNKVDGQIIHDSYGGAIDCSNLYIDNSTFKDNWADDYGGAIAADTVYINYNQDSNQTFNTFFISNIADDSQAGAINSWDKIYMKNTVFSGNKAYVDGGAICAKNDVTISHCLFESNSADGATSQCYGGAIRSKGNVYADNSTFKDNYAEDYGGAIYATNVYINTNQANPAEFKSYFINNKVNDDKGGAIYANNVNAINAVFSGNRAEDSDGGAIYAGDVTANNCTFIKNYAENYGGAICSDTLNVNNCLFNSNKADDDGGAVCILGSSGNNIYNCTFDSNRAWQDGGAIYNEEGNLELNDCTFVNNRAEGDTSWLNDCDGGAVHTKAPLLINHCDFRNNYAADNGGAVYATNGITWVSTPSNFVDNTAYKGKGGAIYTNVFNSPVRFAVFFNNHAGEGAVISDDGGAIYINNANTVTFSECAFIINHCSDEGGAIYLDSTNSHLTLTNNYFLGNTAGDEGQIVFNKGHFDTVSDNWWADNLPSKDNDLLIEWKFWESNVHHVDSNPVYMKLKLASSVCNVGDYVWATVYFCHYNDGSLCNGEMYTGLIGFLPTPNTEFGIRYDHENYVNILVRSLTPGMYPITANLYGQFASDLLLTFEDSLLTNSYGSDEPSAPLFDEDYKTGTSNEVIGVNNGNANVANYNRPVNAENAIIDLNNDVNIINSNSTNNTTSVTKSIDNPQTNGGNNNIWLIILAILAVLAVGGIIKKYKS